VVTATGFSRAERIRTRRDFVRLSACNVKVVSRSFVVLAAPSDESLCRIGITVSRKVGNAVCRNRIKRLVREFFRNSKGMFPPADINIIARNGADKLAYPQLSQELVNAIHRIGQQLCR
jgi:ribonuclease P protein component